MWWNGLFTMIAILFGILMCILNQFCLLLTPGVLHVHWFIPHQSHMMYNVDHSRSLSQGAGSRAFTLHYPTLVLATKSFSHPLSSSGQESGHSCPEADLIPQPLSYVPGPALPFTHHCLCAVLPPSCVGSEYVFTVFYIVRCFFQTVLELFCSYLS